MCHGRILKIVQELTFLHSVLDSGALPSPSSWHKRCQRINPLVPSLWKSISAFNAFTRFSRLFFLPHPFWLAKRLNSSMKGAAGVGLPGAGTSSRSLSASRVVQLSWQWSLMPPSRSTHLDVSVDISHCASLQQSELNIFRGFISAYLWWTLCLVQENINNPIHQVHQHMERGLAISFNKIFTRMRLASRYDYADAYPSGVPHPLSTLDFFPALSTAYKQVELHRALT